MPLNGLFGYHFQWFMGIYFYHIGLKYTVKSTCYFCYAHIFMKSYQLMHITFFNSSNNSYHFKLMGCRSLPLPHRYRHKSQNEPVTKVTTIHFTPERSSPPVEYFHSLHQLHGINMCQWIDILASNVPLRRCWNDFLWCQSVICDTA